MLVVFSILALIAMFIGWTARGAAVGEWVQRRIGRHKLNKKRLATQSRWKIYGQKWPSRFAHRVQSQETDGMMWLYSARRPDLTCINHGEPFPSWQEAMDFVLANIED